MNYAHGYMKIEFFGRHFVRLPLTGPGGLKFITDSLPLFWLNETFLIEKIRSLNDVRQCHAT